MWAYNFWLRQKGTKKTDKNIKRERFKLIQIYHGNGKGKTTAAVGQVIRASGSGFKVIFSSFLKDFSSGEIAILNKLENVEVFDKYKVENFIFTMNESEKAATKKQMQALFDEVKLKVINEKFTMVVFDEILDVLGLGWLDEDELIEFLTSLDENVEIVLTGRNPSDALCEVSDYITQMKCEKHPFDAGKAARKGIEF